MKIEWRNLLKQIAPALATVVGGPMAGAAIKVLSEKLLGHADGTEADVELALASATPEQLLAIKVADQEFAAKMAEIGLDYAKLEVSEKASARSLFTVNYWPQITLSAVFVVGYFSILVLFMTGVIRTPPEWKDALTVILGVLTTGVPNIMAFWFGSTFGSKEKTAALTAISVNGAAR